MSETDLASKTKTELLRIAQRLGLRGISTLSKADLVERIQQAQEGSAAHVPKQPIGVAAVVLTTMGAGVGAGAHTSRLTGMGKIAAAVEGMDCALADFQDIVEEIVTYQNARAEYRDRT